MEDTQKIETVAIGREPSLSRLWPLAIIVVGVSIFFEDANNYRQNFKAR